MLRRVAAIIALTSTAWGLTMPAAGATSVAELTGKEKAAMEAAFDRADANSDGKLSREEASRLPVIASKFDELDQNKDGALSLGEFAVGYLAAP